jgi:small subunit ribosomal protein S20
MAITRGAKKAIRSSARKQVFNLRRKRTMKTVIKEIEDLVKSGKGAEAQVLLPKAYKALDKAAKMNTIKAENASRKKSRLSAAVKKVK